MYLGFNLMLRLGVSIFPKTTPSLKQLEVKWAPEKRPKLHQKECKSSYKHPFFGCELAVSFREFQPAKGPENQAGWSGSDCIFSYWRNNVIFLRGRLHFQGFFSNGCCFLVLKTEGYTPKNSMGLVYFAKKTWFWCLELPKCRQIW